MEESGSQEALRKGPWKLEEDEVLLNHVKRFGPRDWSSIRSKGLLQRTGKSCRLRWVNKLRPNLKKKEKPVDFDVPSMEAPKLSSASEGDASSRPMSCSSSFSADNAEAVDMFCSLPDLYRPKLLGFGQDFLQPEFNPFPITIKSDPQTNFHPLPLGSTFSSQGLLHDPNIDVFLEPLDVSQLDNEVQFPFGLQFYEPMGRCSSHDVVRENVENPESFFNEFPADILDQIELLPSSPEN
ncbi:Transcription factor DUO1, partial [Cucurbita argyrosperma subsp. argyrosperma]